MNRDTFRMIRCPWCGGFGYAADDNDEFTGCIPCGGNWKREGHGVIYVKFQEERR